MVYQCLQIPTLDEKSASLRRVLKQAIHHFINKFENDFGTNYYKCIYRKETPEPHKFLSLPAEPEFLTL